MTGDGDFSGRVFGGFLVRRGYGRAGGWLFLADRQVLEMILSDANGSPISVRTSEGVVHAELLRDTLSIRAEDMADFCEQLLRTADWVLANDPGNGG